MSAYVALGGEELVSVLPFFLTGAAQEWVAAVLRIASESNIVHNLATLKAAFMQQYADIRREPSIEARARLMRGEAAQQQGDNVMTYLQAFREIVRDVRDMSAGETITWFLNGLAPGLKKACAVDENGKDWLIIDDLVSYAYGQETRAQLMAPAKARFASACVPRVAAIHSKQRSAGRPSDKTHKSPVSGARGGAGSGRSHGGGGGRGHSFSRGGAGGADNSRACRFCCKPFPTMAALSAHQAGEPSGCPTIRERVANGGERPPPIAPRAYYGGGSKRGRAE
jgi:uncharacterized membrane protein YgcG